MDLNDYSDKDLLKSALAEVAKSAAELKSARSDIDKAQSRLKFTLLVINRLIDRKD
jgi:hypothetical protein